MKKKETFEHMVMCIPDRWVIGGLRSRRKACDTADRSG